MDFDWSTFGSVLNFVQLERSEMLKLTFPALILSNMFNYLGHFDRFWNFKIASPKKQDFWPEINVLKGKYEPKTPSVEMASDLGIKNEIQVV